MKEKQPIGYRNNQLFLAVISGFLHFFASAVTTLTLM